MAKEAPYSVAPSSGPGWQKTEPTFGVCYLSPANFSQNRADVKGIEHW